MAAVAAEQHRQTELVVVVAWVAVAHVVVAVAPVEYYQREGLEVT